MLKRPDWDEYFLKIALAKGERSPCERRRFGAIIVKNNIEICSGYNGPAKGTPNCHEIGCLKNEFNEEAGKSYNHCRAGPLHAEVNAIINAATNGVEIPLSSKMYIAGQYADGICLCDSFPCKNCQKQIINTGRIEEVIIRIRDGAIKKFKIEDWVKESYETENKDIRGFY